MVDSLRWASHLGVEALSALVVLDLSRSTFHVWKAWEM
mgnify:CR=1 FL=1